MMTPRETLDIVAEALDSYCVKSPYAKADLLLTLLSKAGFEVLPTALVDAVLDAALLVVVGRGPDKQTVPLLASTHADLEAYRAPVLLRQTEETQP